MQVTVQIVAYFSHAALFAFENVLVLGKVSDFLLQVVDCAVQVVSAISEHVLSLVTASLIVQNHYDHVPIYLLAILSELFEQLLGSFQGLKSTRSIFIP